MTEHTTSGTLPVINHMLGAYKEWYGIRDTMPKKSRYTLGDRIDNYFIRVLEILYTASYQSKQEKLPTLQKAISAIDTLKFMLQVAWEVKALDNKKYASLSEKVQQVGKETGGWKKGLETKTSGH